MQAIRSYSLFFWNERNTVVVNLKRVTPEQAKRIVDFLSGTIYAIGGDLQKIGGGIFLCTPNNVSVQGKITNDTEGKGIHEPVADNSTVEGRALNRRVEILILPSQQMIQEAQNGTLK